MAVAFKQVDAFTRMPFAGNPAGVVLDADGLPDRALQLIAREVNASETVFVLSPTEPGADLRLRWFTPTTEVPLCGHATIAAFHAMAEEGRMDLKRGSTARFRVQTLVGQLEVEVQWVEDQPLVWMELPLPSFFPYPGDYEDLCGALGLAEVEVDWQRPIWITQHGYVYVPVVRLESLRTMQPNALLLERLGRRFDVHGFAVFTQEVFHEEDDWFLRFFAPGWGVLEDPVTGTAQGPLGAYWYRVAQEQGQRPKLFYRGEQGDLMARRGRVAVRLESYPNGELARLWIGGQAVTVFEGRFMVRAEIGTRP
ncbi:MAG: PhzF family phenazine biosynthesis protein [Bacteroidetes bacterium]|nr:PhzF family phenazine biosynthesis protein [Rhodothermia bacterium]MCS7155399.1 PhzF family phenazine biosynthesis protein [Bacteroidota bacterium]MCX7907508.1 PhzF family phenazine biosynthesis protein [Bacteroidota bacterium]MDW8138502.1 PhzF family phenazine biosynthesis protein [Bacteroidota bacterium]MDW8284561.1 PhzF family phenazine biosynthesis protein [Bacteroidota bacterium]